jgi:hypothetical protein
MSNKNNQEQEEINLGSLFVVIGRIFTNFFNFIGRIFSSIFHFIISILIFLKEHILKIGIAVFLGAIIGAFFQFKTPEKYSSEMILAPNFKSTRQLYNNIEYYSSLVKQRDTSQLQTLFNLTRVEAGSIKKIEIEPIKNDNDIISGYNSLITISDSLAIKSYPFEDFKTSFTDYDYRNHRIYIESEVRDIFPKLGSVMVNSVLKNSYFTDVQKTFNLNLNRENTTYNRNLTQLDSLSAAFKVAIIDQAKNPIGGTNLNLSQGQDSRIKELEVFETTKRVNLDLRNLAFERSERYEIINIISDFQNVGKKVEGITKNYISLFALIGFITILGFLLIVELNKFLNNYSK